MHAPYFARTLILATALFLTSATLAQEGATLTIDLGHAKAQVSPQLYGLMTEEINSFDGGLYGELVRNRTFHDKGKIPSSWFLYESGIGDQILNADLGGRAA